MSEVYLTRYWVRKVDERAMDEYGMASLVLMENAGRGCADLLESLGIQGTVVICCGKGNNAGDGLVIARHLDARGYSVKVLLWCEPERLRGDAAINYGIARLAELPLVECPGRTDQQWLASELSDADWIVDALLGTGSDGPPRPPLDTVIRQLNDHPAKKFAVDLPSGLNCDLGQPASPTFRADHTATFVALKAGFREIAAKAYLGEVHVLDIGAPRKLLREIFARVSDSGSD